MVSLLKKEKSKARSTTCNTRPFDEDKIEQLFAMGRRDERVVNRFDIKW